jgi:hypothetical protein
MFLSDTSNDLNTFLIYIQTLPPFPEFLFLLYNEEPGILVAETSVQQVSLTIIISGFLFSTSILRSSYLLFSDVTLVYQHDRFITSFGCLVCTFFNEHFDNSVESNKVSKGLVKFPSQFKLFITFISVTYQFPS